MSISLKQEGKHKFNVVKYTVDNIKICSCLQRVLLLVSIPLILSPFANKFRHPSSEKGWHINLPDHAKLQVRLSYHPQPTKELIK